MRFRSHHISGYHLHRVVISICSKPADKLVPFHCHKHRIQDSSLELQGMVQQVEEGLLQVSTDKDWLLPVSMHNGWLVGLHKHWFVGFHKGWFVGFCCHTLSVGNGMVRTQQDTEHGRET